MSEILLNCLAVPSNLVGEIGVKDVVTIKIDDKDPIHFLREEIRKKYSPLFDNIPITKFGLRSLDYTNSIQAMLASLNWGNKNEGKALNSMDKISEHFPKDKSEKDIHVIVYLNIQTSDS